MPHVDGGEERPVRQAADRVAAVGVGGCSLVGGRGGVGETVVGLFAPGARSASHERVDFDSLLKSVIRAIVLLSTVIFSFYARRSQTRRQTAA